MKNKFRRILCLLLALLMTAGLSPGAAAVDGGEQDGTVENRVQAGIRKGDREVYVGQKSFKLEYEISGTYDGGVEWSSSDPEVADVDQDGNVTIGHAGIATITLTLVDSDAWDSIVITVSDDNVTGFEVTSPDGNMKDNTIIVKGRTSFTLRGKTTYESGRTSEGISWGNFIDSNGRDEPSVVKRESPAGKFTTFEPGEATIECICPDDPDNPKHTVKVTVFVQDAPVTSLTISGEGVSGGKVSMTPGEYLELSAEKSPASTFNEEPVTWKSSDEKVLTVSDTGTVKAIAKGTAKITASCAQSGKTVSAYVTVTVADPSADISDSTTRGSGLSFSGIYSDLVSKFTSAYGKPSGSATIRFNQLGSSTYATLYTKSSSSTKVAANKDYPFSDVKNMYLEPDSSGSYEMTYTLTDGGNTLTGKITVKITGSNTKNITVKLRDDSPYAFNSSSTVDRVSAASAISTAIRNASGSNYSYIEFEYPSSSSSRVGTLYPDSSKKYNLEDYRFYTSGSATTSKQSPVSKLYFEPKREGSYTIGYTAYSSSDVELCSGELVMVVGAADSASVTVNLDDGKGYAFSSRTTKDRTSAASAIDRAVDSESGSTYSYIVFGSVTSGSNVGTLYSDSDLTSVSTSRRYYRSAGQSYNVSSLYFVPERAGAYVRSFVAYDSSGSELLDGTLKIVVPGSGSGAVDDMDIFFNNTTGSTRTLGEDIFSSWFRQQKGQNYNLAYVTFDEVSNDTGSFKYGNSSFTPDGSTAYYTSSYSGNLGSTARYLKNVKYVADGGTGCVSVDFTCYGGTGTSATGTKLSGNFCIFVTKGSVDAISYDVDSGSKAFDESSFASVYKKAMSSGSSSQRFYIELLELPSSGSLYYKYSGLGSSGRLTSGNLGDYKFYVNGTASSDSVGDLTYVPVSSASAASSVKLRYLARDTNGDAMYVGTVTFNFGGGKSSAISCGADGYTFKLSDFYSGSDSDSVSCVTFRQPNTGELMINYANGRGVPLDASVRLYTVAPSAGSYPLSAVTYIPRAGFTGNVTIDYTCVTESGASTGGVLTVSVSGKTSSSRFQDVTVSGSGAWAADSIDFAYRWGLVSGTGDSTFSPDNTMSRAMLVTVLYRAAGSPAVTGSCPFRDVGEGDYFRDAVVWAVNSGITSGRSATSFDPNGDVTREQVAAFLHRYAEYSGRSVTSGGSLSGYTDESSVSAYAVGPMAWAVYNGYITSASSTEKLLSPVGNATRAQVAVMLHRFLTY